MRLGMFAGERHGAVMPTDYRRDRAFELSGYRQVAGASEWTGGESGSLTVTKWGMPQACGDIGALLSAIVTLGHPAQGNVAHGIR